MKAKITLLLVTLAGFFLIGPIYGASSSNTTTSSAELGYVKVDESVKGTTVNPIRAQALKETATSLAAQGALAWRAHYINSILESEQRSLDQIYNFDRLMLPNNVLPPVLEQSSNNLNQADSDTLRLADRTYKILSPARFVTTPPTWRTYLWLNFRKPEIPDKTLLPKNAAEVRIWNRYLKEGWKEGLLQANQIFSANMSRLKRDYLGMVLYRKLYAQKMVSAPFVAKSELGVTGNENELRINDQVMKITSHSGLQTNSSKWKPVLQNRNNQSD